MGKIRIEDVNVQFWLEKLPDTRVLDAGTDANNQKYAYRFFVRHVNKNDPTDSIISYQNIGYDGTRWVDYKYWYLNTEDKLQNPPNTNVLANDSGIYYGSNIKITIQMLSTTIYGTIEASSNVFTPNIQITSIDPNNLDLKTKELKIESHEIDDPTEEVQPKPITGSNTYKQFYEKEWAKEAENTTKTVNGIPNFNDLSNESYTDKVFTIDLNKHIQNFNILQNKKLLNTITVIQNEEAYSQNTQILKAKQHIFYKQIAILVTGVLSLGYYTFFHSNTTSTPLDKNIELLDDSI